MPVITPRYANNLLKRYRTDLEELNRRIRILEWLARGEARKKRRTSSK